MQKKYFGALIFSLFLINSIALALKPIKKYSTSLHELLQYGVKSYDSIYVKTEDGANIFTAIFYPEKKWNNKTIVIAYGDAGNLSDMFYHITNYVEKGYKVVGFDYRGFGYSSDFAINKDFLFYTEYATDLKAVIRYVKQPDKKPNHLGIYALSMGTLITTLATETEKIDFIIAENYVVNPTNGVQRLKKEFHKTVLLPALYKEQEYQYLISNLKLPMLIFSALLDKITTVADTKIFVKNKKAHFVNYNGHHLEGLVILKEQYFKKIFSFIERS